jgi:hypothetical protein
MIAYDANGNCLGGAAVNSPSTQAGGISPWEFLTYSVPSGGAPIASVILGTEFSAGGNDTAIWAEFDNFEWN